MNFSKILSLALVGASLCLFPVASKADDLQKIEASGKLAVALSGAFPPFSFVDETNKVVGFDVDVATEIAKRLKVKPEIITTAWDGIIAGLVTGRYDAIISSMGVTEERKKAVAFVGPYYHSGLGLFVQKGSPVKSLDELGGKTIAVGLGDTAEKWVRDHGNFEVRTYKALPDMLLDLAAGRVDAVIQDDVPVLVAITKNGAQLKQIKDDRLPKFDIGIAIRKNNPELAAAIQKALDGMMADGTYSAISTKWIGTDIR